MFNREEELKKIKQIDFFVIANDLSLRYKAYSDYYQAYAFWRGDEHPSLTIQKRNGEWMWYDHGTGQGGTWIDLYMTARNMSYVEAVKHLRNLGTKIRAYEMSKLEEIEKEANKTIEVLKAKLLEEDLKEFEEVERILGEKLEWNKFDEEQKKEILFGIELIRKKLLTKKNLSLMQNQRYQQN